MKGGCRDQNGKWAGQKKLGYGYDYEEDCLAKCKFQMKATGCAYNRVDKECWYYTKPVTKGSGQSDHKCWKLSKIDI